MSSIENFSSNVERTYIGYHKIFGWILAGFAIFGPKMAIFGKFCILRTLHPRNLCDPSKEPQYTNYMGCCKTCTPLKWPEVLKNYDLWKTWLFLAILKYFHISWTEPQTHLLILFFRLKSLTEASRNKISFVCNFLWPETQFYGPN